jgi:metallo-beta-lactamase family protein
MPSITFYGATQTTTGSKFLVKVRERTVLVECGMFQGAKEMRLRNWSPPPFDPGQVDDIILTHTHIDHTGYLPKLAREGFSGRVYATSATADLLGIVLKDAAHLQEEDAKWANKRGFSKHTPALPLYTIEDAERAIGLVIPVPYGKPTDLGGGVRFAFRDAGHILGSAIVELWIDDLKVVFTGDLGRYSVPILRDPQPIQEADYLVTESTYGNRTHQRTPSPTEELASAVNRNFDQRGCLLIPSFAVGRTQTLLYEMRRLEEQKTIPEVGVYVDSPMAIDATDVFYRHPETYDGEALGLEREGERIFSTSKTRFVRDVEESKELNSARGPLTIISASGMATGGRILHHLARKLPQRRNTVLFVGFQVSGTRGRALIDGAETIKIHGEQVSVKAQVQTIEGFSAHADCEELLTWMKGFEKPPKKAFIVHGEPEAQAALGERMQRELGWETQIPTYAEEAAL